MSDTRLEIGEAAQVVETVNPDGLGPVVLACEHASSFIPPEFGGLGLNSDALDSHIAWDPGALAVATHLSRLLDAPLVAQRVSRLVYDCNRPPSAADAIPARSEIYSVPGNAGLSDGEKQERTRRFYEPFHQALGACLDARMAANEAPILVTIHSFTPVYFGARRDVEFGILHDNDSRLADVMLGPAGQAAGPVTRRNEPYGPEHGVTHTLKLHGLSRGIANVMLEIRNDLIATLQGQIEWADRIADLLRRSISQVGPDRGGQPYA